MTTTNTEQENIRLLKILQKLDGVTQRMWNDVLILVLQIQSGKAKILSSNHEDDKYRSIDYSKISTWSTFDEYGYISLYFSTDGVTIKGDADIYENRFGGRRGKVFNCVLELPLDYVSNLQKSIEWALEKDAEQAYEQYLETQQSKWMKSYIKNYLKD